MTATLPARETRSDDRDLVARAREGECDAFSVLYERHVDSVTAVARARVGSRDADDVVQDAFVRAWERLDQLQDGAAFGGWVRAIAVRLAVDVHRRAAPTVPSDELGELPTLATAAEEHLLRREVADELHTRLAALSARDRQALWLRDGMEAPIPELAERFDLSEGSTRVMLSRARQRLRAAYVAVVAGILGLRGLRSASRWGPSMVAASALVAVPLLVVPAIRGGGAVDGGSERSGDVRMVQERSFVPAGSPAAPEPVRMSETARPPASTTPAAPSTPVDPEVRDEPDDHGDVAVPVTVEERPAPDGPQAVSVEGEDGQGDVVGADVFAGTVADAVNEVIGTDGGDEGGDSDSPDGSSERGSDGARDECLLPCG